MYEVMRAFYEAGFDGFTVRPTTAATSGENDAGQDMACTTARKGIATSNGPQQEALGKSVYAETCRSDSSSAAAPTPADVGSCSSRC